ncbi:unnamed protein product [Caretta caretta]
MTVQVRRAAMFLLFKLMSMFQAGLGRFWDNYMMDMLLYVEEHKTSFCQREWEQQLLQLLEDLLFFIPDHIWLGWIIASIRRHLAHSDKQPDDKSFLYKCWGTMLMFFPAESIKPQLWLLVEMVDFREEEERERIYLSSQFSVICKLSEGAIRTILQIIYEDIEQNWPQDRPLGHST